MPVVMVKSVQPALVSPPVRTIAVITIIVSTLDLLADIVLCVRFGAVVHNFCSRSAEKAVYFFYVFTVLSAIAYIVEMVDCVITIKRNQETRFLSRASKSALMLLEEIPLPICILIIYTNEPRSSLATSIVLASCVKLNALVWAIVKFTKLRFCWFFLPCTLDHGTQENVRRCFTWRLFRLCMFIVNVFHMIAVILTVINIINASDGGHTMPYCPDAEIPPVPTAKGL